MPSCLLNVLHDFLEQAIRLIHYAHLAQQRQLLLYASILLQHQVELPLCLVADSSRKLGITLPLLL